MEDQTIVCSGCNNQFVCTAQEQEWLQQTFGGTFKLPKRCPGCRHERRKNREEQSNQHA